MALKKMNGADLGGRQIRVDMANPPSSGGERGRGGMCVHVCMSVSVLGVSICELFQCPLCNLSVSTYPLSLGFTSQGAPTNKLFVVNISTDTEPYTLEELFTGANDVYLPKDRETGERRGWVELVTIATMMLHVPRIVSAYGTSFTMYFEGLIAEREARQLIVQ